MTSKSWAFFALSLMFCVVCAGCGSLHELGRTNNNRSLNVTDRHRGLVLQLLDAR